jgi:hypothetical protein
MTGGRPPVATGATKTAAKNPAVQKRLAEYRAGPMRKRLAAWKPHEVTPLKITNDFWFTRTKR